jgi:hypothetical protein
MTQFLINNIIIYIWNIKRNLIIIHKWNSMLPKNNYALYDEEKVGNLNYNLLYKLWA